MSPYNDKLRIIGHTTKVIGYKGLISAPIGTEVVEIVEENKYAIIFKSERDNSLKIIKYYKHSLKNHIKLLENEKEQHT